MRRAHTLTSSSQSAFWLGNSWWITFTSQYLSTTSARNFCVADRGGYTLLHSLHMLNASSRHALKLTSSMIVGVMILLCQS